MQGTGAAADASSGFPRGITRYQWLVFFVVWAGWTLDAADFGLYSLVLQPALRELMVNPTPADIGRVGGLISTAGLLGWAFGGFTFGILADYIGRVRTLALSILIFSVFTALQGLAQTPFQLGFFRFFAGVGTGAEIIVGIPFVAEAFAEKNRARILGIMMTGGAVGTLLGGAGLQFDRPLGLALGVLRRHRAGAAAGLLPPRHGRAGALRGGARAARGARPRRDSHSDEDKEFLRFVPLQLFNRENRFSTMVGLLFCVGTLLAIWTSNIWLPTIQRNILATQGIQGNDAISYISFGMTMWALGGHLRLCRVRLHRRRDRPPPDDPDLQCRDAAGRPLSVPRDRHVRAVPVRAVRVRVLRVRRVLGARGVSAGAVPDACARDRGVVLQRHRADHHQLRPAARGLLVGVINLRYATAGMTCFALLSILAMGLGRETRYDELPR